MCLTERGDPGNKDRSGSSHCSPRISESSDLRTNERNKLLLSSQRETIENTSNSLVSAKVANPVLANSKAGQPENLNSSRQAPSNSIDYGVYDEDDYRSMWADISQNTNGCGQRQDEEMTEYSGIFH